MEKALKRIVITGIGLVAPNADNLPEYRHKLLHGESTIQEIELRYFGKAPAGICFFDETKYRKKKENKKGTRAGCIGVYCANEAVVDAGLDLNFYNKARIGV